MYVLTQQLQQLERRVTNSMEQRNQMCLEDWQQTRKVSKETPLLSFYLSLWSIYVTFRLASLYCQHLETRDSYYKALWTKLAIVYDMGTSLAVLGSLLMGLNESSISSFVFSANVMTSSAISSFSLIKTVYCLCELATSLRILSCTSTLICWSRLSRLELTMTTCPRWKARTKLTRNFSPPEQFWVLVCRGMSAQWKSSNNSLMEACSYWDKEVRLGRMQIDYRTEGASQAFYYAQPLITLSPKRKGSLARKDSACSPVTEQMEFLWNQRTGMVIFCLFWGACSMVSSISFLTAKFPISSSILVEDIGSSSGIFASSLSSSIALCAVRIPAMYHESALRGKLSMPSRQTNVLGVNTDCGSTVSLNPIRKQAVITILLMPTPVNCHSATHQQSSNLISLRPIWNSFQILHTRSQIQRSSQLILNSLTLEKKPSKTFSRLALRAILRKRTLVITPAVVMVLYMTSPAIASPKKRAKESLRKRQRTMAKMLKHSKMRLRQLSQQLCRQTDSLVFTFIHNSIFPSSSAYREVDQSRFWQQLKLFLMMR